MIQRKTRIIKRETAANAQKILAATKVDDLTQSLTNTNYHRIAKFGPTKDKLIKIIRMVRDQNNPRLNATTEILEDILLLTNIIKEKALQYNNLYTRKNLRTLDFDDIEG